MIQATTSERVREALETIRLSNVIRRDQQLADQATVLRLLGIEDNGSDIADACRDFLDAGAYTTDELIELAEAHR